MKRTISAACVLVLAVLAGRAGTAQTPRAPVPAPVREDYPQRPPADPALIERGKALYVANCAFCHGPDARGGNNGGPNLLRSQLVLSDQRGELIATVVQNGRPGTAMVPINLSSAQIADIAEFIHSFRVGGYDISREKPQSIVVGNGRTGEQVFRSKCASCHSISGDLKGIGAKVADARDLQQMWLMPSSAGIASRAMTATVTLPSSQKIEGRLLRVDDFTVTLALTDGTQRTFARDGDSPKVEIHDPLQPHRDLLPKYTDDEIHDITAFLVTLK